MSGGGNGQGPRMVGKVEVEFYEGGAVQVKGFPAEYQAAMGIMSTAMRVVMDFFMDKAVKGEFREQRILRPAPGTRIIPK